MDKEICPGVVIAYDDFCPAVYISDDEGEVVMWTFDEIEEDHSAWTASLNAVAMAAQKGPRAVRLFMAKQRSLMLGNEGGACNCETGRDSCCDPH